MILKVRVAWEEGPQWTVFRGRAREPEGDGAPADEVLVDVVESEANPSGVKLQFAVKADRIGVAPMESWSSASGRPRRGYTQELLFHPR